MTLYLYTRSAQRLHSELGFYPFDREFYEGQWVTLMAVELAAQQGAVADRP